MVRPKSKSNIVKKIVKKGTTTVPKTTRSVDKLGRQTEIVAYKSMLGAWIHKVSYTSLNFPVFERALEKYYELTNESFIYTHLDKCTKQDCIWKIYYAEYMEVKK